MDVFVKGVSKVMKPSEPKSKGLLEMLGHIVAGIFRAVSRIFVLDPHRESDESARQKQADLEAGVNRE